MLQTIRERAQGWIAWAIVILISIPFALWGIQSYLGVGSEPVVAKVNGVEITQRDFDSRYQQTRMQLRERLGAAYRPEMFDEQTMRQQVLDAMIQENLLLQDSYAMGLRASDQELRLAILANPAFQKDGRFDKLTYERMLQLQGMSELQYENNLRQRIVGTQLQRAVAASAFVTKSEITEAVRVARQQRQVSFLLIPKKDFLNDEPIPDADVEAYYHAHQEKFRSPERVKLRYLVLDANSIDSSKPVDEGELRKLYEEHKDRYTQPEERRARHILLTVPPDADKQEEDAVKARIEKIRARILAGEDFGKLAKELSQDPGSAAKGGDLGFFEKGMMDPTFDKAVFSLKKDEISQPVRSRFGYHLIEVTAIRPAKVEPFEAVRKQLATEAVKDGAARLYYDDAERLANLTYENPDSLEPAAKALGLKLQTSGWIDRKGGKGILANPKVTTAAFSEDLIQQGVNSELIEPEPNAQKAVVLRVLDHEDAFVKPLDQVREEIVTAIRDERAAKAAKAAADQLEDQFQSSGEADLTSAKYAVQQAGLIGRQTGSVPDAVRNLAFTLPHPAEGKTSFGTIALADGDAAVVAVSKVVDGSVTDFNEAERNRVEQELKQLLSEGYYQQLMADMEKRADIERKPVSKETGQ